MEEEKEKEGGRRHFHLFHWLTFLCHCNLISYAEKGFLTSECSHAANHARTSTHNSMTERGNAQEANDSQEAGLSRQQVVLVLDPKRPIKDGHVQSLFQIFFPSLPTGLSHSWLTTCECVWMCFRTRWSIWIAWWWKRIYLFFQVRELCWCIYEGWI